MGEMRPCLAQLAAITITQTFVDTLRHLDITKEHDRVKVVRVLGWVAGNRNSFLSLGVLQNELQWRLKCWVKGNPKDEAPLFLACMLALCCHVDTNQIEKWRIPSDVCQGILEVVTEFQRWESVVEGQSSVHVSGSEGEGGNEEKSETKRPGVKEGQEGRGVKTLVPLHTKSLLCIGVLFLDNEFLPRLVEKMPILQHFALRDKATITLNAAQALSRYCKHLECMDIVTVDEDYSGCKEVIISSLFGVPSHLVTKDLLKRLSEEKKGKKLRKYLVPQLPNLRVISVCIFERASSLKVKEACILALLLQPALEFLKHMEFPLDLDDFKHFCRAWSAIYGPNSTPAVLPLKQFIFSKKLCSELSQPESQVILPLFGNLKCMDLWTLDKLESEKDSKIIEKIIHIFSSSKVNAMFLSTFSLSDMSILAHLQHLRLVDRATNLHVILDCCPNLSTLDIDTDVLHQHIQERHQHNHTTHTKLIALSIFFVQVELHETLETFLYSVLRRLPVLRCFTFIWSNYIGPNGISVLALLESTLTRAARSKTPLLTHLEELWCKTDIDWWNVNALLRSYSRLMPLLPALHYLTLPKIMQSHQHKLVMIHKYFRDSNIYLRFKSVSEHPFRDSGAVRFYEQYLCVEQEEEDARCCKVC